MNTRKEIEYLRHMAQLCLEQAKLCLPNLGREALEEVARNYREKADRLESLEDG